MGMNRTASGEETLVSPPENPVGYVMALFAVVTGGIHLLLAATVFGFSTMMAALFALNGIGFLGGVAVYFTRFWRRELYVLAAVYALATIVALFVFQGFGVGAFYRNGGLNPLAVVSKGVEVGIVVCALYLFSESS